MYKRQALIYIENECRRLSRLSMKMLELTGLYEASEDSFNPVEIQVDNFLKEVKELIDCRLQEKNISLDVFCEPKELVKKFDQDLSLIHISGLKRYYEDIMYIVRHYKVRRQKNIGLNMEK